MYYATYQTSSERGATGRHVQLGHVHARRPLPLSATVASMPFALHGFEEFFRRHHIPLLITQMNV